MERWRPRPPPFDARSAILSSAHPAPLDHAPARRLQGRIDVFGARLGFVHRGGCITVRGASEVWSAGVPARHLSTREAPSFPPHILLPSTTPQPAAFKAGSTYSARVSASFIAAVV